MPVAVVACRRPKRPLDDDSAHNTAQQLQPACQRLDSSASGREGVRGSNGRSPRRKPRPDRPPFPHPALRFDRIEPSIASGRPLRAALVAPNRAFWELGTNRSSLFSGCFDPQLTVTDCLHGPSTQHTVRRRAHHPQFVDTGRSIYEGKNGAPPVLAPGAPPPERRRSHCHGAPRAGQQQAAQ